MNGFLKPQWHEYVYVGGLFVSLVSLPFSEFLLSVGLITIAVNWLLCGGWGEKVARIKGNYPLLIFLLLYASVVVGALYSANTGYALSQLRLKLPLLLAPIVIASSKGLGKQEFRWLFASFVGGVLLASGISTVLFMRNYIDVSHDFRSVSPFISHIRFSLMVVLSVVLLVWSFGTNRILLSGQSARGKGLTVLLVAWFLLFLVVLQSLTGLFIAGVLVLAALLWMSLQIKESLWRFSALVGVTFLVLFMFSYATHMVDRYFTKYYIDKSKLPSQTINGNKYFHDTASTQYENGYPVWINICFSELATEWNKVAKTPYGGADRMGQPLRITLIRYMTSKGLRKDSVGVSQLDATDIGMIESGATSVVFREHRFGVYPRIYQLLWEVEQYLKAGQVSGSTLVQRFVFAKASVAIIADNLWLGTGTGDYREAFRSYYLANEPGINPNVGFISHNQYLFAWVTTGLWGFIVFLVGFVVPPVLLGLWRNRLFVAFMLIVGLSMLNEDTLETHTGVSFVAIFISLLLFSGFNSTFGDE
ncbi:MAG: O-antigen ligase family protein [Bacteroidales bacterium]|nr:O-antigen ligase family protein [Bacteroidales bacterium]MBN2749591.1 O-antigen ligase family protein [Bacteroidales bacterium]